MRRLGVGTKGSERGAAIVEAAIILPLVILLTFGALEVGFALSDASGLRSSVRSGARIGAALSRQPTQLKAIVDAVNEGLKSLSFTKVTHLYVYADATLSPVTSCSPAPAKPKPQMCVDIDVVDKNQFDPTLFIPTWNQNLSSEDACVNEAWKLGVTVVGQYGVVTKIVAVPRAVSATMLIDLEPTISSSCKG